MKSLALSRLGIVLGLEIVRVGWAEARDFDDY
jgi:hypothetical protein